MKKIHLGTNFTVFLLLFGVGMLGAFKSGNWMQHYTGKRRGINLMTGDTAFTILGNIT